MTRLFVPGRLCLFGEHSDWAGGYRDVLPDQPPGYCLVMGTDQGIHAVAEARSETFEITSNLAGLLPTILYRCPLYRFAPLAIDDLIEQLVTQHEMDRERATLVAALSGGSLPQALELEEEALVDVRNEALRIASVVVNGARYGALGGPTGQRRSPDGALAPRHRDRP